MKQTRIVKQTRTSSAAPIETDTRTPSGKSNLPW